MTRAVIFDFGNVLCFPPAEHKIVQAAAACHLPVPQFEEAFWRQRLEYDAGKLDPMKFWSGVAGRHLAQAQLPELVRHEVEFWNEFDVRVFAWIDALRANGVKTGILSNLPRVLGEQLRATRYRDRSFLDHFDHVTFSYELLTAKPDAPIYRHAYEGLGVEPKDTLFLDDKQPNVDAARAQGMRAELFTTWEAFVAGDVAGQYGLQSR